MTKQRSRTWDVEQDGAHIGIVQADGRYLAQAELNRAIATGEFPLGSRLVATGEADHARQEALSSSPTDRQRASANEDGLPAGTLVSLTADRCGGAVPVGVVVNIWQTESERE